MKKIIIFAAGFLVLLFVGCLGYKESVSTVYGHVLYNGSLPVKGAEVTVFCESNRKQVKTVSDGVGYYSAKIGCLPETFVRVSAVSRPTRLCVKDKCRDLPAGGGVNKTIITKEGYAVLNINVV